MSKDDSISNYDIQLASTGQQVVQPAPGVEWVVLQMVGESSTGGDAVLLHHTSGDRIRGDLGAGNTAYVSTDDFRVNPGTQRVHSLTNAEYLQLRNSNAGTMAFGFSGFQTK